MCCVRHDNAALQSRKSDTQIKKRLSSPTRLLRLKQTVGFATFACIQQGACLIRQLIGVDTDSLQHEEHQQELTDTTHPCFFHSIPLKNIISGA